MCRGRGRGGCGGPRAGGDEFEIAGGNGAWRDVDAGGGGVVAGIGDRDVAGTGGDLGKRVETVVTGEGSEAGAGDGDLDVPQVFLGDWTEHAALDRAGGGGGGGNCVGGADGWRGAERDSEREVQGGAEHSGRGKEGHQGLGVGRHEKRG